MKCLGKLRQKLDFFGVVDVARAADMPYADIVMPVATSDKVDRLR